MTKKPCHCCNGSGLEKDEAEFSQRMKASRLKIGISQKDMAAAMGISASMLVFLESGRRRWKQRWIAIYVRECRQMSSTGL
jgi:DNA-binding XRE family transcriptional regulator